MNDFTSIVMGGNEPIETKGKLFVYGIEERMNKSLEIVQKEYDDYETLKETIDYVEYFHSDTVKSDIDTLRKVGYYPAVELEMELDHSIKHALIGSYKSAFSDLRRALELCVIFAYLISENTDRKKAVNWIKSKHNTIAFSKAIKQLIKQDRFKEIEASCNWLRNLQELYMDLSSFSHNKGMLKGYRELNGYFGQTVPPISVKWCHFERCYNNINFG